MRYEFWLSLPPLAQQKQCWNPGTTVVQGWYNSLKTDMGAGEELTVGENTTNNVHDFLAN